MNEVQQRFIWYIIERWNIHRRRQAGQKPPWTTDPVLAKYKFCNVRREDDRVTRWVADWLRSHADRPHLWFAAYVARTVNNPASLELAGWPVPWRPKKFIRVLRAKQARGEPVRSNAYCISSWITKFGDLPLAMADRALTPAWEARNKIGHETTCSEFYAALRTLPNCGPFMAAQTVADVKWWPPLRSASDWATFAAPGYGSARGLNRYIGRPPKTPWQDAVWHQELLRVRKEVLPQLPTALRKLDAQNVEHALCEFDKYERAASGEKMPATLFRQHDNYVKGNGLWQL